MASSSRRRGAEPASTSSSASSDDPLLLVIRFSAPIPDLPLDVLSPDTTTSAGLKQLIRSHLPAGLSARRLRLIYSGRALEDATALSLSLKLPPSSARAYFWTEDDGSDSTQAKGKGKGKEPVRDRPRRYIHCSIGDIVLSDADLAAEVAISSILNQSQDQGKSQASVRDGNGIRGQGQATPSTIPAPRGFDRLLSAGFTPAEVSALRSQFLAVQSVARTPDTMPSGAELHDLEDRWMDEGSAGLSAGQDGFGGIGSTDDDGGFGPGSHGAIDDMLWGAIMGFFWPIGCAMWLRREEGVWSWRKGLAILVGVLVNAAFGAMRILN